MMYNSDEVLYMGRRVLSCTYVSLVVCTWVMRYSVVCKSEVLYVGGEGLCCLVCMKNFNMGFKNVLISVRGCCGTRKLGG